MFNLPNMNKLAAPAFFFLLSTFLAGVPESGARGGKGARGAGGVTGYGHRGVYNSAEHEMTWEDIVLAMQLSAMCFGALLALCIVACCAYKICGPAEEEDWARRYRTTFKPVSRLTPEMLKEIYTLPTTAIASNLEKKDIPMPPGTPVTMNTTLHKHSLTEGAVLGTAVSVDIPHHHQQQQHLQLQQLQQQQQQQLLQQQQQYQQIQQQRPLPLPPNLTNGRAIMEESARGGGGCLSLGGVLDHRPRVVTLSSLSTSRLLTEARRPGVAPRLAAHLNNSTLDLVHPQSVFMPILNASSRSLSEPQTAIV